MIEPQLNQISAWLPRRHRWAPGDGLTAISKASFTLSLSSLTYNNRGADQGGWGGRGGYPTKISTHPPDKYTFPSPRKKYVAFP